MNQILKFKSFLILITFISIITSKVNGQAFGFGCLGLSGVYAGYSNQEYNADGFNSYLNSITNSNFQNSKIFGRSEGIKVGANIFRANFSSYFVTLKGFYQFLKETNTLTVSTMNFNGSQEFELKSDYWGFGLDFGFNIFGFLDLKLAEGGVAFYNIKLNNTYSLPDGQIIENKYSEPKSTVGYYLGSGLILHLVKNYISIEATAIYNSMEIESLKKDEGPGVETISSTNQKLITKGGLGVTVQLNLGFPL